MMCGRFSLSSIFGLQERFEFENDLNIMERYNVAPTQSVVAVRGEGVDRRASLMKWGLIPHWAKDQKIGYRMINARAETVAEKPSYKRLFHRQRCLVIADGFFEWEREGSQKIPHYFTLKDHKPFAFAGLWDSWEREEEVIESCTIITTIPSDLVKPIHDRMPVILTRDSESLWMDADIQDTQLLTSLLVPYADEIESRRVSTIVNSVRNDLPECIQSIQ